MRTNLTILLVGGLLVSFLPGCKDKGTTADDTASGDTDTDTDADTDADSDADTDADTDTDTDTDTECWVDWDGGTCWNCDLPTSPESDSLKFLNQCSDATYVAFDNATRIPSSTWTPGTALPSL